MRYAFYASVIMALLVMTGVAAWSQSFTPAELDELLGPIALYPDPLLAQVLPAATYPDQLKQAYDLVQSGGSGMIDSQPWDVSVKAVAHYPDVLKTMATSTDWTTAVGQAYVNQPDDVMKSIQRLRGKARLMGYLSSNSEQTVSVSDGYISIVPAQAQYIYVPTYNPSVVYVRHRPSYASIGIAFGAGLLIGAWLNNAFDWNHHRVYYHGWKGGGWIARSRSHVRINNRTYVNPAWGSRSVPVNRDVRSRDITTYRRDIKRNTGKYAPPGLISPHPGVTTTRPGVPTHRPGIKPGETTTRPGVRPGLPTTKPNVPTARPVPTPGFPGTGPGRHPGLRPGGTVPHPVTPGVKPNVPSTTHPNYRPSGRVPHPMTPTTTPRVQPIHPSTTRPSGGAVRSMPSGRPSGGGTGTAPKGGNETKGNAERK